MPYTMKKQHTRLHQPIDFSRLLKPLLKYWYLIALSIGISIVIAQVYLRRAIPVYEMQTTILVRNNEEDGLTKDALQKEILGMGTDPKIYEDARILRSHTLREAIIDSLKLQYRIVKLEPSGEVDVYDNSPIELKKIIAPNRTQSYPLKIIDRSNYSIQLSETDRVRGIFGEPLNTDDGSFLLTLQDANIAELDTVATFVLKTKTLAASAQSYLGSFAVEYNNEQPTILDLFIRDEVPQRGLDILNRAVQIYNRITLESKSKNRKNTLAFIEERIDLLVAELNQVEQDLEQYKTKESLTVDFKADLPYIQDRIGYFEREIVDVEIQQNIMQYIAEVLDSNKYQFYPLVDFGLDHKGLSDLIIRYNALLQDRYKLRQTVTENYPSIQLVDEQINSLKISIRQEVTKNLQDLEASLAELKNKNQTYLAELDATPRRERELVNKQRQQTTKENLYKYLLEKREEAAVSIAAVGENARIIDPPFLAGQVSPKRNSILLGALLVGFLLPFSVILLFTLFDNRVRDKEELLDLVDTPVIGSIVAARGKSRLAIQANNHSPTAESFRSLRANLDFFLKELINQIVMVTSTSTQEGKSFTTVNLGMSYALSGKKVLLMDFDLRNPKVPLYLGVNNPDVGVSDYLNGQAGISELIQVYEPNRHLHYIASGPIPANPSELLMSKLLPILLEELKEQYDIIILDSPAVGLVSDALRLARFADAGLYMVRMGITDKEDLKLINELTEGGKIANAAIVFNGVSKGRTYKRALKKGYYQKVKSGS